MGSLDVLVLPPRVADGRVRIAAQLQSPERAGDELWYELDEEHRDAIVDRADPFVVASLLLAMREGVDLHVRGAAASPSLLRNLEEFQQVWHAWYGLHVIDVVAEQERSDVAPDGAVASFSGGVDSAFTAYSSVFAPTRYSRPLRAALMVHGMDIPREEALGFKRALARSQRMLSSIGLPIIPVTTNAWEFSGPGTHFSALGVAAAMHVVGGGYGAGLLASTASYDNLLVPLDSSPLSDHLLGCSSFEIVHFGSAFNRVEKVRRLAEWEEAVDNLRVCLEQPGEEGNCGRCHKCMTTYLVLRVLGVAPRCFDPVPSEERVLAFAGRLSGNLVLVAVMRAVLDEAEVRGLDEPWVKAARRRMRVLDIRRSLSRQAPRLAKTVFALYGRRPHVPRGS